MVGVAPFPSGAFGPWAAGTGQGGCVGEFGFGACGSASSVEFPRARLHAVRAREICVRAEVGLPTRHLSLEKATGHREGFLGFEAENSRSKFSESPALPLSL